MSPEDFSIAITRQGWLNSEPTDPSDLCSHGYIRLVIGGEVIAPGDEREYTISTSALGLLRTLESDHSPERPVGSGTLILHCGMLMMLSCPVGIDWSVTHRGGRVRLRDIVRFDSTDASEAVRFPGLEVELEEEAYRREVVAFARSAKGLFVGAEKVLHDDTDRKEWGDFWEEYERLLAANADSG